MQKTEENSRAIGRPELSGDAFKIGFYDMAFLQILWTQNETRLMPNPLRQFPTAPKRPRSRAASSSSPTRSTQGGAGCASCHHNGNKITNGVVDDTFQDFNIHEPGVIAETTVDNEGPFTRLTNDYFFKEFNPPQDLGGRQNISSRNTKHLRAFWDSVPRWLHHGDAHSIREILLAPDSPLLQPGERGFNFRTVRTDHQRAWPHSTSSAGPRSCCRRKCRSPSPTAGTAAARAGGRRQGADLRQPRQPVRTQAGRTRPTTRWRTRKDGSQIDRLGTSNLAPLIVGRPDQPGAGGQPHPGDQGHARQDVASVRGGHRGAVGVPAVAAEIRRTRTLRHKGHEEHEDHEVTLWPLCSSRPYCRSVTR